MYLKIKDTYWKHTGLHLRFQDSQEKDSSESAEMLTALYRDTIKLSNMNKDDIYSNMKSLKSDRPHCQHLQILKRKIYGVLLYQILRVRSFKTIF